MKEIIDIYTKLVIATFGFIGPSFTLLISIFIEAIEKARIKHEQQLLTINTLTRENVTNPAKDIEEEMKMSLSKLKDQKKKTQKELNLLNPKRQIKRVFIPLVLSLIFIELYYFEDTSYCPIDHNFYLKLVPLVISVLMFIYCLFALSQILFMVIEAKQALIKENTDIVLEQEEDTE